MININHLKEFISEKSGPSGLGLIQSILPDTCRSTHENHVKCGVHTERCKGVSERQRTKASKFDSVHTESGASVNYAANINENKAI